MNLYDTKGLPPSSLFLSFILLIFLLLFLNVPVSHFLLAIHISYFCLFNLHSLFSPLPPLLLPYISLFFISFSIFISFFLLPLAIHYHVLQFLHKQLCCPNK